MIQHVIDIFQSAGIKDILVITGGARGQIESLVAGMRGVHAIYNPSFASGEMLGSIQCGLAACASTPREIRVLPPRAAAGPGVAAPAGPPAPPGAPDVNAAGLAVARTAESLLGLPYRDGGALPDGFVCSGLVSYVFARYGIAVPRDVRRRAVAGAPVATGDIVAGDLVFFSTTGSGATHVGIAIGEGRFIHAPKSGDVVRAESMSAGYWTSRFVMARRIPVL